MIDGLYAIEIDHEKCKGRLACIRICPTQAMRYRKSRLEINPVLCIDCGDCITECPEGAIRARTDPWDTLKRFKFKVAIVSPVLFSQFPRTITPYDIVHGLLAMGFDAVYDLSLESEIYFKAVKDYLEEYDGPLPLISSNCPVVIRLIQVSYPNMVEQVTPIQPPRDIAARTVKKKYSERFGLKETEVGAIYISPCPAKIAAIKAPAEHAASYLDLALGIRDIYNPLLLAITKVKGASGAEKPVLPRDELRSMLYLNLAITGGLSHALQQKRFISVAQLPNIENIFGDIEKGKIKNIDFLECFSCTGGCIGGSLTVDNRFVALSKLQKVIEFIEREKRNVDEIMDEHYQKGAYFLEKPLKPREIVHTESLSIIEQIERVKKREDFFRKLPDINCSLCGAPTCEAFATDVTNGTAEPEDCVLMSDRKMKELREFYRKQVEQKKKKSEE